MTDSNVPKGKGFSEEAVVRIPLNEIYSFPEHPFGVRNDEYMRETVESIRNYGVLVPVIVRPRKNGGYEMISGDIAANMLRNWQTSRRSRPWFGILIMMLPPL